MLCDCIYHGTKFREGRIDPGAPHYGGGWVERMKALIPLCLSLTFSVNQAFAHHSFAASFTDEEIQTEGVVLNYVFRNPHVVIYLNVTDDAGDEVRWMVEGGAATSMRKSGWSNDTIQRGEYLRVTGRAGRDGRPMINMGMVEVLDPETRIVLRTPSVERPDYVPDAQGIVSIPLRLADGRPNLTGAWVQGRGGPGFRYHRDPPFNEVGVTLQGQWDPAADPQVACELPGLVRQAGYTPHPVRITQNDDHVIIEYEEYGGRRVIYFDDRDFRGGNEELARFGRSRARYEGDTLIIESSHMLGNPTGTGGNWLSDQTTIVETYRRDDDPEQGPMVAMEMIIEDPGHLTAVSSNSR